MVAEPCPSTLGVLRVPQNDDTEGAGSPIALRVEEAIELVGIGPFQRRLWLLCSLGVAGDAMEKAAVMYIMQGVSKEWNVQGGGLGLLGAFSGVGQAIGSSAFGRCSDRYGRRSSLLWALLLTFSVGGFSALAPTYASFLVLRFAINLGLGGALPCAFTLLLEYVPARQRSRWMPWLYVAFGVGRLLTSLVAWCLLEASWRAYLVAIALPSGVLLLCCRQLPETPQFLLARGRPREARAVLEALAAENRVEEEEQRQRRPASRSPDRRSPYIFASEQWRSRAFVAGQHWCSAPCGSWWRWARSGAIGC